MRMATPTRRGSADVQSIVVLPVVAKSSELQEDAVGLSRAAVLTVSFSRGIHALDCREIWGGGVALCVSVLKFR
jgi:hypothetical protein